MERDMLAGMDKAFIHGPSISDSCRPFPERRGKNLPVGEPFRCIDS
jgi:hypothetical protein